MILSASGATPGAEKQIVIRGINSINLDSGALLVVDGRITESISYISPCNIKSIEVIDSGSLAIYGQRGGNGMACIETKLFSRN